VAEAVLVANAIPLLRWYDHAPLIQPILFKTTVYWAVVFVVRLLEHFVEFSLIDHNPIGSFLAHMPPSFGIASLPIQISILVLFLIYVTASEFNDLFGGGEVGRMLFSYRPSKLQLNRRQRIREFVRLSKLADAHTEQEFRDPTSTANRQLLDIVRLLAR